MTYQQVLNIIKSALTLRPSGTKVQVEDHEAAEIAILDYIELLKLELTGTIVREAHAAAVAGVNCNLVWNTAFDDTDYTYTINAFDIKGNPVAVKLISKSSTKLVIKTLVGATMTALAMPYSGITA